MSSNLEETVKQHDHRPNLLLTRDTLQAETSYAIGDESKASVFWISKLEKVEDGKTFSWTGNAAEALITLHEHDGILETTIGTKNILIHPEDVHTFMLEELRSSKQNQATLNFKNGGVMTLSFDRPGGQLQLHGRIQARNVVRWIIKKNDKAHCASSRRHCCDCLPKLLAELKEEPRSYDETITHELDSLTKTVIALVEDLLQLREKAERQPYALANQPNFAQQASSQEEDEKPTMQPSSTSEG